MFIEINNELINIDNISKIRKTKNKDNEWRILFMDGNSEVVNISFGTELEMTTTYDKLKAYLITKKSIKGLGEL